MASFQQMVFCCMDRDLSILMFVVERYVVVLWRLARRLLLAEDGSERNGCKVENRFEGGITILVIIVSDQNLCDGLHSYSLALLSTVIMGMNSLSTDWCICPQFHFQALCSEMSGKSRTFPHTLEEFWWKHFKRFRYSMCDFHKSRTTVRSSFKKNNLLWCLKQGKLQPKHPRHPYTQFGKDDQLSNLSIQPPQPLWSLHHLSCRCIRSSRCLDWCICIRRVDLEWLWMYDWGSNKKSSQTRFSFTTWPVY